MNGATERVVHGLAAAAAGLLYWWLLTYFWSYWSAVNPIAQALFQPGAVYPHYRWILYPTDWLTSVIVSLPFAVLLVRSARRHLWLCVAAASAACFFTVYWPGVLQPGFYGWAVVRGLIMQLTFLPLSVGLVLLAQRRFSSDNASRPTPLRGRD